MNEWILVDGPISQSDMKCLKQHLAGMHLTWIRGSKCQMPSHTECWFRCLGHLIFT